jgi:hypothetical protein
MGAGSVVAVQKARPDGVRAAASAPKPARGKPRPVAHRTAPAGISDCPLNGVGILPALVLAPLPENDSGLGMGSSASDAPGFPGSAIALPPILAGKPGGGFGGVTMPGGGSGGGAGSTGGGGGGTPVAPPTIPAVPEPKAWVMMTSGFGLIGFALRRNRPATA